MADPAARRPQNVAGPLYVDTTCIDCGTCMWMAPDVYEQVDAQSAVVRQPGDGDPAHEDALAAVAACPTGSIGVEGDPKAVAASAQAFPREVEPGLHHCGFHARGSFGATPWLVRTPDGNVLVDSPRFAGPLVKRLEEMGGVRWMLLTHRDDVADHARFAERFGCERVIHADDRTADTQDVERVVRGLDPVGLFPGMLAVPTPGHTKGSMCYLWQDRWLFTGDHLAWSLGRERLTAFRRACWYDWPTQVASMERLLDHRFERVLPGHGAPVHLPPERMHQEMERLVAWMRTA